MAICQAFREQFVLDRWHMLARRYPDVDVTLIGPKQWENREFARLALTAARPIEEERFRVIPVDMVDRRRTLGGWDAPEVSALMKTHHPDFIYLIGVETQDILFRVALAKRLCVPDAKICGFTMRGLDLPYQSIMLRSGLKLVAKGITFRLRWKLAATIYDAYFTHYPHGAEVLRTQGKVTQPIYLQTQVGVDARSYRPDEQSRREVRSRWGLRDEFVFGSLSRIDIRKGLLDILEALPLEGNSKFMMIGDGPDMERVRKEVCERGLEKYVILPGYIERNGPVAAYLNALDGFVHVPQICPDYIDTFPLVVAQAMAVGLPVIAADSGGAPYQLGGKGITVPWGNPSALKRAMEVMAADREKARAMGETLRARLLKSFEISHLTDCFNCTMRDILDGKCDPRHVDQQEFSF
jgi:glycosyltransferase involved in cell wall biosynthesis